MSLCPSLKKPEYDVLLLIYTLYSRKHATYLVYLSEYSIAIIRQFMIINCSRALVTEVALQLN